MGHPHLDRFGSEDDGTFRKSYTGKMDWNGNNYDATYANKI